MDSNWFKDHVVFLTGATGNLGGCLLYKLAIQLPTAKIFVLIRGSVQQAIESWEQSMSEHVDEIIATGKIKFFLGDMTQPNLGLTPSNLLRLQNEVTLVINSAGDISLSRGLAETLPINCTAHLTLAALADSFTRLTHFLHVSTTFVSSFLPDGTVKEKIYTLIEDPKEELATILATGQSSYTKGFAAPYALAKYLAERLLLEGDHSFPVLIGSDGAIPVHSFIQVLFEDSEYGLFKLEQVVPRHVACNEIPVDLVARNCLAHVAKGTKGVVHASSDLYVNRTVDELFSRIRLYAPKGIVEAIKKAGIDHGDVPAPELYSMINQFARDWRIECTRSTDLKCVHWGFCFVIMTQIYFSSIGLRGLLSLSWISWGLLICLTTSFIRVTLSELLFKLTWPLLLSILLGLIPNSRTGRLIHSAKNNLGTQQTKKAKDKNAKLLD
ncbi:unnamed protein product [Penicillium salamii]|nr:unnamed protein product [Penicillium salamii]